MESRFECRVCGYETKICENIFSEHSCETQSCIKDGSTNTTGDSQ